MNYELKRKINTISRKYICCAIFTTFFFPELVVIPMTIGTIKVCRLVDTNKNIYKMIKTMSN